MSLMDHVGPYARRGATVKRGSLGRRKDQRHHRGHFNFNLGQVAPRGEDTGGISGAWPTKRNAKEWALAAYAAYPGGKQGLHAGIKAQDVGAGKYYLTVVAILQSVSKGWPVHKAERLIQEIQDFEPSYGAVAAGILPGGKDKSAPMVELVQVAIKYGPPPDFKGIRAEEEEEVENAGVKWQRLIRSLPMSAAAKEAAFESSIWGILWGTTVASTQDLRAFGAEFAKFSQALGIGLGIGFAGIILMQTGTLRAIKRK